MRTGLGALTLGLAAATVAAAGVTPATAAGQTVAGASRAIDDSAIFLRIAPPSPRALVLSRSRLDSLHRVLSVLENQVVGSPAWTQLQSEVATLLAQLRQQSAASLVLAPGFGEDIALPSLAAPGAPPMLAMPMPRGWIGLSVQGPHDVALTPEGESIHYFDYPLVVSVDPNSPADRSGLTRGDVLVAYDGADLRQSWINMGRLLRPERKISITVKRDGQTRRYNVVVDSAPMPFPRGIPMNGSGAAGAPSAPMPPTELLRSMIAPDALFGAVLSDVTPGLSAALDIPAGVLVNAAAPESPAYKAGIRVGDVVTRAGGRPVASVSQFRSVVLAHSDDRRISVNIRRKGAARRVTLRW